MPKPFPLGIYVGTDICSIPRIASTLERYRHRFINRLLTNPEREAYHHKFFGESWTVDNTIKWLAGRWAAKEAIIKACSHAGQGRVTFHDVVILPSEYNFARFESSLEKRDKGDELRDKKDLMQAKTPSPAPKAVLLAPLEVGDWKERWRKGEEVRLSISHDDGFATAVAMVAERVEDQMLGSNRLLGIEEKK